jgi:SAM-dependent methyltransferase
VFSQQVLEHVMDDVIEAYYAEEGRVLKPGGLALHQVPHRLVPFDSHTGTWFVHYLPRVLRLRLYCWLGHDPDYVERLLCLRWPEFHRVRMIEHVGSYQDLTLRRLVEIRDFGNDGPVYDGSLALRRMIGAAIDMPVIGRLAGAILRRLVMIESLSVKRS